MIKYATLAAIVWLFPSLAASATWTEIRTPHYVFYGDASRRDMQRIAQRFEQFHAVMQQVLSRASVSFPAPAIVLVFRDQASFRPYQRRYQGKPVESAGMAISASDLNYVALTADGGSQAYPIVFHELAHLISAHVSTIDATWFREGVAEYYSSFEMRGDDEVLLGLPIGRHAALLRERFMPLRELFAVDHSSPAYNESSRTTLFYAESWALLHYLHTSEATRDRFPEFMRLIGSATPPDQSIQQAFGIDTAALETALRSYVRQFSMMAVRLNLKSPISTAALAATDVDEAVVLPHLANFLIRVGRPEDAEPLIRAAAGRAPASGAARAALAQLRLQQGRPAEAVEALAGDLSYDGFLSDYLVASALAHGIATLDRSATGSDVIERLRTRAVAAAAAHGDVPEAWRLAAYAHLLSNDAATARAAIEQAIARAPATEHYRFMQVNVLLQQHDFKGARSILGQLMGHGRSAQTRTEARQMMGRVVEYEHAVGQAKAAATPAAESANSPEAPRNAVPDPVQARPEPRTLIPVFRNPKAGETRTFGSLAAIECGSGRVALVVRVGDRVLRLVTTAFDRIDFVSYRSDLAGQVTCAARVPPDPVYVTWSGRDDSSVEIRAESIVVEFTPPDYKPR